MGCLLSFFLSFQPPPHLSFFFINDWSRFIFLPLLPSFIQLNPLSLNVIIPLYPPSCHGEWKTERERERERESKGWERKRSDRESKESTRAERVHLSVGVRVKTVSDHSRREREREQNLENWANLDPESFPSFLSPLSRLSLFDTSRTHHGKIFFISCLTTLLSSSTEKWEREKQVREGREKEERERFHHRIPTTALEWGFLYSHSRLNVSHLHLFCLPRCLSSSHSNLFFSPRLCDPDHDSLSLPLPLSVFFLRGKWWWTISFGMMLVQ